MADAGYWLGKNGWSNQPDLLDRPRAANRTFHASGTYYYVGNCVPSNTRDWYLLEQVSTPAAAGQSGGWDLAKNSAGNRGEEDDIRIGTYTDQRACIFYDDNTHQLHSLLWDESPTSNRKYRRVDKDASDNWTSGVAQTSITWLQEIQSLVADHNGHLLAVHLNGANVELYDSADGVTWSGAVALAGDASGNGLDMQRFTDGANQKIEIAYTSDTDTHSIRRRHISAQATVANYRTVGNWSSGAVDTSLTLEEHLTLRAGDGHLFALQKDQANDISFFHMKKGAGSFSKITVDDSGDATRPSMSYDATNGVIYVCFRDVLTGVGSIQLRSWDVATAPASFTDEGAVLDRDPQVGMNTPEMCYQPINSDTGLIVICENFTGTDQDQWNIVSISAAAAVGGNLRPPRAAYLFKRRRTG